MRKHILKLSKYFMVAVIVFMLVTGGNVIAFASGNQTSDFESSLDGWDVSTYSDGNYGELGFKSAKLSATQKNSGSSSVELDCKLEGSTTSNRGMIAKNFNPMLDMTGKTLTVNVYIPQELKDAGTGAAAYGVMLFIKTGANYNWHSSTWKSVNDLTAGWNKVEYTPTDSDEKNVKQLGLNISKGTGSPDWAGKIYVDDISIASAGSTSSVSGNNNLKESNDFETSLGDWIASPDAQYGEAGFTSAEITSDVKFEGSKSVALKCDISSDATKKKGAFCKLYNTPADLTGQTISMMVYIPEDLHKTNYGIMLYMLTGDNWNWDAAEWIDVSTMKVGWNQITHTPSGVGEDKTRKIGFCLNLNNGGEPYQGTMYCDDIKVGTNIGDAFAATPTPTIASTATPTVASTATPVKTTATPTVEATTKPETSSVVNPTKTPEVTATNKPEETIDVGTDLNQFSTTSKDSLDGMDYSRVKINNDQLLKAIESKNNELLISKYATDENIILELESNVIEELSKKDLSIKVINKLGKYKINTNEIFALVKENESYPKTSKVEISISKSISSENEDIKNVISKNGYGYLLYPVSFKVQLVDGDNKASLTKLNSYSEKVLNLPNDMDISEISTGIVLNSDGTISQVPTKTVENTSGKFAVLNSLSNSSYTVVFSPKTFNDIVGHWAANDIMQMGSRLVISGMPDGRFEPNNDITRAEFATIVINALGIGKKNYENSAFTDVEKTAWYNNYVNLASDYKLISGYGEGIFKPTNFITRQEAMVVMLKAMKLLNINNDATESEVDSILSTFNDSSDVDSWAKVAVATCVKNGIVKGSDNQITPKQNISRAQVTVILKKIMEKANMY